MTVTPFGNFKIAPRLEEGLSLAAAATMASRSTPISSAVAVAPNTFIK